MASIDEGVRLLDEQNYSKALETFLSVDVDPEEHPELSYYLGLCYTNLEKYDEAVLYLEQAAAGESELPHIYQSRMLLGYIYTVTDRHRLAEFEFSRLLEEGFESARVHAALGHVQYALGKTSAAIMQLEKALEIDGENPTALNSIGYIMADNGIRLQAALSYCKRAVAAAPENPAYLDSLGWCYFKLGHPDEARTLIKRAHELAPENEEITEHWNEVRRSS
ncbi:MAG: tetratricopeptide repeat protein [Spirochaetaceae bacterium]